MHEASLMTNPPTDEMREAFEKWAKSKWGYNLRRSDVNRNDYHYLSTQRSWQGWQAALSHQGEVVESENERIGAFVRRVEREGASNLHQSMAHAFITHALSGEHDEAG
jgi:hypothetical protein